MSDADSALRERLERTRREAEYSKKKLQQQHEEVVEEHEAAKKLLERKVSVIVMNICRPLTEWYANIYFACSSLQTCEQHCTTKRARSVPFCHRFVQNGIPPCSVSLCFITWWMKTNQVQLSWISPFLLYITGMLMRDIGVALPSVRLSRSGIIS